MSIYFQLKEWLLAKTGLHIYRRGTPLGLNLHNDLRKLSPGFAPRVVLDVGGNIGQTVRRFTAIWPKATIYSFEPVKSTYEQLVTNTRSIKADIRTFNIALSDRAGSADILLSNNSQLATLERPTYSAGSLSGSTETIQMSTLDDWCNANAVCHIDLLKIDTEGHDLKVLRGGANLIDGGHVDAIFVENFIDGSDDQKLDAILKWTVPRGFQLVAFYDQQTWIARKLFFGNSLFMHARILV